MSAEQIEHLVNVLRDLPEADQRHIANVVQALQTQNRATAALESRPGLELKRDRGLLVYTGEVSLADPVGYMREERDRELARRSLGW